MHDHIPATWLMNTVKKIGDSFRDFLENLPNLHQFDPARMLHPHNALPRWLSAIKIACIK